MAGMDVSVLAKNKSVSGPPSFGHVSLVSKQRHHINSTQDE